MVPKRVVWIVLAALALAGCSPAPAPGLAPDDGSSTAPAPPPAASAAPLPSEAGSTPTAYVPPPQVSGSQRWIEIDLGMQVVRLREGDRVLSEHLAASGVAVSPETTTWPGVYQVQQMIEGPIENVPGVFVADILIFDWSHEIGIHSMPQDKDGNVLDGTLGQPVSAGCVRVADSAEVYDFAQLGTKVWVH